MRSPTATVTSSSRPRSLPFDTLLGGGLPRGKAIEIAGRRSAGRFSIVLSALAAATSIGEAAALIDLGDNFDPQIGQANGIELTRLLWIRPRTLKQAVMAAEMIAATGFQLVVVDAGSHPIRGRRVPDAAWVRLARTAEANGTAMIISTPYALTGTATEAVVSAHTARAKWLGRGKSPRILAGTTVAITLEKHRHIRPGRSAALSFRTEDAVLEQIADGRSQIAGGPQTTDRRPQRHSVLSTQYSALRPLRSAICDLRSNLMARLACFFIPLFPLAARLRSEPDLREQAVAIVEGNGNNAHVIAATRRARTKGICAGLSLAQARALLPKLIARGRDSECERTAQEALLDVAETFSPRLEDAGEGVVFFDVTGMDRHWTDESAEGRAQSAGGTTTLSTQDSALRTSPELRLAQSAIRAAEAVGLPARCGIAGSKLAARVAAELPKSPTVVPSGDEPAFLAPLPLRRLSPELEAAAILDRWGLTSIGDLARLPESEVASRLGEIGRDLHVAARGIDPRPLIPRALPPEFREGMELEWPLVALEPFLFIANAALDRLSARMEMQGFACRRLELTMTLEPDGYHARAIDLPAPTRDVKTMLTLLRLELEKNPPGAPVCGFSIVAHPDRPRRAQLSLFGPSALAPEKLATAIARLVSLLGEGRVGMPVTVDGHLPERFDISSFSPPPPPDMKRAPRKSRGLLAVRVFRPPIPVEVMTRPSRTDEPGEVQIESIRTVRAQERSQIADRRSQEGDGIDSRRYEPIEPARPQKTRVEVGASTEIEGSVRLSSGPWRVEEGWWADTPADRDYWDIELQRGGIYRVYRDEVRDGWFVDARYD